MQKEEIQKMFDVQNTDLDQKLEKQTEELKGYMRVLTEDFQHRLSLTIEYLNGKIDHFEGTLNELRKEIGSMKSDIVDIRYDVHDLKGNVGILKLDIKDIKYFVGMVEQKA